MIKLAKAAGADAAKFQSFTVGSFQFSQLDIPCRVGTKVVRVHKNVKNTLRAHGETFLPWFR